MKKTCTMCKTPKDISKFYPSQRHFEGYYTMCIICHRAASTLSQNNRPTIIKYNRIAEALDDTDISRKQLAPLIGKSYVAVIQYCTNWRQPSIPILYKIAEILDVHPTELLISPK